MNSDQHVEIIIPMAGKGKRFTDAGYEVAKPFIEIHENMMIEHVLKGLAIGNKRAILVVQKKHEKEYKPQLEILKHRFAVRWTCVEGETAGAACTALAARHVIQDKKRPVLFVDCDNIFQPRDLKDFIADAKKRELDASLLTFPSNSGAYSYVRLNENDLANSLHEKQVVSTHAVAGAYYFSSYEMFEDNAIDMLIYGDAVKQEYYMSQVYNCLLKKQSRIGIWQVNNSDITCVGTPEQLESFLVRKNAR